MGNRNQDIQDLINKMGAYAIFFPENIELTNTEVSGIVTKLIDGEWPDVTIAQFLNYAESSGQLNFIPEADIKRLRAVAQPDPAPEAA